VGGKLFKWTGKLVVCKNVSGLESGEGHASKSDE
jgi:hypothetical protein